MIVLFLASGLSAGIIYVDNDGPADFNNIQAAIDYSNHGDTILVRSGVYLGAGNRRLDFRGKGVLVLGESGPMDCIIDCENMGSGIYLHSRESGNSVINGFTIRNGHAYRGGGIYCDEYCAPTILNCVITDNQADYIGGGIYFEDDSGGLVQDCIISYNSAELGAGICCNNRSAPVIIGCRMVGNSASKQGGGLYWDDDSAVRVVGCEIVANSSRYGGGIFGEDSYNATITNCTVAFNTAYYGGGFYSLRSGPRLANCILWGDSPDEISGGAFVTFSNVNGGVPGQGNIESDPWFVDPSNYDYHLQQGSPCINAGDPTYGPDSEIRDIDNETRVMDGRVDIGADEFNPFRVSCIVVDRSRVDRATFEYECEVLLENISGYTVKNAQLELIKPSENMTIVEANVSYGNTELGPGESVVSNTACVFRVDRSRLIDPYQVVWQLTCERLDTATSMELTIVGTHPPEWESLVRGSVLYDQTDFRSLSELTIHWLQPVNSPLLQGESLMNFIDFAIWAEQWHIEQQ